MAPKNLFEMFGHHCDIVHLYQTKKLRKESICDKIINAFNRFRTINETNKGAYTFFRSQKKIENEKKKHMEYELIIHPFSDFRKYWEMIMILIMLTQFIQIPLDFAFHLTNFVNKRYYETHAVYYRLFVNFFSLLDIIITFLTGYLDHHDNVVVLSPLKIVKRYILGNFLIDLHTSISIDQLIINGIIETNTEQQMMWHASQLISVFRYRVFIQYCCNFFETINCPYIVSRLMLAVVTFFLYTHLVCCMYIGFINYSDPWYSKFINYPYGVTAFGSNMKDFGVYYSRFFYGALLLIMNSGYCGKLASPPPYMATLFIWFISRFLYAVTIGYFMSLQTAANSSYESYVDMITEVQGYMRHRQVPSFLQKRILAFYDIKFKNSFFQEEEILNTISAQLKQEITLQTSRKMVQSVTFFKGLPAHLLVRIVSCMVQDIFLTNDVIIKAGTLGDCMYFIACGSVAVYTRSGKEITHLEDGDYFGEISLITDSLRTASVIAADVAELYKLDKKDFTKCILPYPDLYSKIETMAWERKEKVEILDEINKSKQVSNI